MKIAIIGAGASGLFLSMLLKDKYDITIFERNKKVGSKLLASGNGRCNLLNENINPNNYNNQTFIKRLLNKVSFQDIYNVFKEKGLQMISDDEGRVYPLSNISSTVLNIMLDNINANIILNHSVQKISKKGFKYLIDDYKEEFDYVILGSGSIASLPLDKQKSTYNYLDSLNIKTTNLKPSLVGFKTKEILKDIQGVRVKALVKLYVDGKLLHTERGEVIFKNDGISGIVIMNMSSYYNRYNKSNAYLLLDILEGLDNVYLKGALNPVLYDYVIKNIIDVHNFKLNIIDTYDTTSAQVISGGVSTELINDNFSLIKDKNIYLMGEMLDIDAVCGGYNMFFAFASSYIIAGDLGYENKNKSI